MRKLALISAAAFAALSTPAFAAPPPPTPTLHGFCAIGDMCTDNGTNTPTDVNPPVFSFATSGQGATGNLVIDILVPNSVALPANFTISGALLGASTFTANLFDSNGASPGTPAWTSGDLKTYLGISASPNNPLGAFLPGTQTYQPSATGFYVFQANLGTRTLLGTNDVGGANNDNFLMQLGQAVAQGTYIVGFFNTGGATANSGAILVTDPPPPPLPEPGTWAMMLFGFGGAGVAMRRARRKTIQIAQLA